MNIGTVQGFIDFNPRSYKRSDNGRIKKHLQLFISIHAPTRGATSVSRHILRTCIISIHAPTRGATFQLVPVFIVLSDFNPRSYKRSDSKNAQYSLCISAIIIAQCLYNSIKTAIIILCNTKNIAFFRCESSAFSCSLMIRTTLKYQRIFY